VSLSEIFLGGRASLEKRSEMSYPKNEYFNYIQLIEREEERERETFILSYYVQWLHRMGWVRLYKFPSREYSFRLAVILARTERERERILTSFPVDPLLSNRAVRQALCRRRRKGGRVLSGFTGDPWCVPTFSTMREPFHGLIVGETAPGRIEKQANRTAPGRSPARANKLSSWRLHRAVA